MIVASGLYRYSEGETKAMTLPSLPSKTDPVPGRASSLESDPLDAESIGPMSDAMLEVLKVGHEVRHGRVAEFLFLLKAHRDNMF